jgi:O-antigen ligase
VENHGVQKNPNCSTWNIFNSDNEINKIVPRGTIWNRWKEKSFISGNFINLMLLIQVFGIILSFSKSAIFALVVAFAYIIVPPTCAKASAGKRGTIGSGCGKIDFDKLDDKKLKNGLYKKCSTSLRQGLGRQAWNNVKNFLIKMFHVEQFRVGVKESALFAGLLASIIISLVYFKFDFQAFFIRSLEQRSLYLNISQRIISDNSILGVGTGQFIVVAERIFPNLEIWQYQPVHNVFLLIWSEWGIVGLVLFIVFLWKLFQMKVLCRKS